MTKWTNSEMRCVCVRACKWQKLHFSFIIIVDSPTIVVQLNIIILSLVKD